MPRQPELERNRTIIALRQSGVAPVDIAERLKVSRHVVGGVLARAGMTVSGRRARGEDRWVAKLTDELVRQARADRQAGASWGVLADRYGVATPTIRAAATGKTWSHVQ